MTQEFDAPRDRAPAPAGFLRRRAWLTSATAFDVREPKPPILYRIGGKDVGP